MKRLSYLCYLSNLQMHSRLQRYPPRIMSNIKKLPELLDHLNGFLMNLCSMLIDVMQPLVRLYHPYLHKYKHYTHEKTINYCSKLGLMFYA